MIPSLRMHSIPSALAVLSPRSRHDLATISQLSDERLALMASVVRARRELQEEDLAAAGAGAGPGTGAGAGAGRPTTKRIYERIAARRDASGMQPTSLAAVKRAISLLAALDKRDEGR